MAIAHVGAEDWEKEVLQHSGRVLVDFYATWCPPCRALAPRLERFAETHAGAVKVLKLNSDEHEEIATQYQVRTIPTLIAFQNGQEVHRAINPQSNAALEALLED